MYKILSIRTNWLNINQFGKENQMINSVISRQADQYYLNLEMGATKEWLVVPGRMEGIRSLHKPTEGAQLLAGSG